MTIDREFTDLEEQLISECEKLIGHIKALGIDGANYRAACIAADEVADFITNLD
jgi:hypothetical protein